MTCSDVQRVLPEIMEGGRKGEVQAHLKSCSACSELVSDLDLIASEARKLGASDEPPSRVWVKIAAELRAEGIIREPEAAPARPVLVPSGERRWKAWWLVPVAAALIAAGAYVVNHKAAVQEAAKPSVVSPQATPQLAKEKPAAVAQPSQLTAQKKLPVMLPFPKETPNSSDQDDQQFIEEMSQRAPMMRATYESELQTVNSYIRDAQAYAEQHPGDEDARQHLMDAYAQKSMLYQMALNHVQ
jgi:hypothetical protein